MKYRERLKDFREFVHDALEAITIIDTEGL
jgi:uncharacterized protein YnzC (UPF0291/DUF896 family)